ncbi:MAG: DNA-binding protein [Gammaproteobacteria bacterium]|nr:DNA-binding protein [Gammaproteobacteria bacterium]
MAKIGVTYEEVAEAADHLYEQRLTVTVDRVREELGRGSKTTLVRHIQRWREERQARPVHFGTENLSPELSGMMATLWRKAGEEAEEKLKSAQAQVAQERAKLEEERRQLDAYARALKEQLAESREREARLTEQLADMRHVHSQLDAENSYLKDALAEAESQFKVSELARSKERTVLEERLHGLEEEGRNQSRQHRQEMAEFHRQYLANESRWMQDIDQGRQQIKKLERVNADQAKRITEQQEQAAAQTATLRAESESRIAVERALAALTTELQGLCIAVREVKPRMGGSVRSQVAAALRHGRGATKRTMR